MRRIFALASFVLVSAGWLWIGSAHASNVAPLAFGMTPDDVATALGAPLSYVTGRPGAEVFVVERNAGVPGFYPVGHRAYFQFRNGGLTGWKNEWGMRRRWLF
jgi:hypothetical protein